MAKNGSASTKMDGECSVFRKALAMLFQKSSFIAQNYPSYLCRKVFYDDGNLVEICRKKDMPHKHSGEGAESLIVIYGNGDLEFWVAGERLDKTSIQQITDSGQSSGVREQWLRHYLNLLGEQYSICPGLGLFDAEDISQICSTTEKLFPFRRTISVNCARWINKDLGRCVPCSKEYDTVKHFLHQHGKLPREIDNEEVSIELKMSAVLQAVEDFPHLACRRITHESEDALEIQEKEGDITVGPPGKQFSLHLSRIIILNSGEMKMCVLDEVVCEEMIYKDGTVTLAELRKCMLHLGKNLSACPGFMEELYGVAHISYKPMQQNNESCESKQYVILTCKRTKQWLSIDSIVSSLFDLKYPVCKAAMFTCQCQGCNMIMQQMKDKWPDVFQLFINTKENSLDDIVHQQNREPDSSCKDDDIEVRPERSNSASSCDTHRVPICISPESEPINSPALTEQQNKMLEEVRAIGMRAAAKDRVSSVPTSDKAINDAEVTSSTVLKEIKVEDVAESLSPDRQRFNQMTPHSSRINPELSAPHYAANTLTFPANLNDLLGIYLDLFDQHPDLTYSFELQMQKGYQYNSRAHHALVVKRRYGDVMDFHKKWHPNLKKPLSLASLNIYLAGDVEFIVAGHRKYVTRVTHGGPSRDVINGYLSLLRSTYTFCGGISISQWMNTMPNVRSASVPNLITLDTPLSVFIDEHCLRWYEFTDTEGYDNIPDGPYRCQKCQELVERLKYTQSIIHNTAMHFSTQPQATTIQPANMPHAQQQVATMHSATMQPNVPHGVSFGVPTISSRPEKQTYSATLYNYTRPAPPPTPPYTPKLPAFLRPISPSPVASQYQSVSVAYGQKPLSGTTTSQTRSSPQTCPSLYQRQLFQQPKETTQWIDKVILDTMQQDQPPVQSSSEKDISQQPANSSLPLKSAALPTLMDPPAQTLAHSLKNILLAAPDSSQRLMNNAQLSAGSAKNFPHFSLFWKGGPESQAQAHPSTSPASLPVQSPLPDMPQPAKWKKYKKPSVKEYYSTISTKRPLPNDPLEYKGIKLKRPVLSIRRLHRNDLPPSEQQYLKRTATVAGYYSWAVKSGLEKRAMDTDSGADGSVNVKSNKPATLNPMQISADALGSPKKKRAKKNLRNVKCEKCEACLRKTGCMECDFCLNPEWKQKCRRRQCLLKSPFNAVMKYNKLWSSQKECRDCVGCLTDKNCNECDYCMGIGDRFKYDKCEKRVCWQIVSQVEIEELRKLPGYMENEEAEEEDSDYAGDYVM